MTRRTRQVFLTLNLIGSLAFLTVAILNPQLFGDPRRPRGLEATARWLTEHPADWLAASEISDAALDLDSPRRFQLWYTAYAHARKLAPHRPNTAVAFVRGGLFHWYELGPADRKRVLDAAAPLMRDPPFFARMHVPLWELTRDFAWLRRVAPDTLDARIWLRDLAIVRGLFSDYRTLREEIRRKRMEVFLSRRATDDAAALLDIVPQRLTAADEPLVRAFLEELERRPVDVEKMSGSIENLVEFAVRHELQPLSGIAELVRQQGKLSEITRARAALALNEPAIASRIELTSSVTGAREWIDYYIHRARFESRHGDQRTAEAYLLRASQQGTTADVLAAAEELARSAGKAHDAANYRKQLVSLPRTWSGICGSGELCTSARTTQYLTGNATRVQLFTTQSDETAPYVEIYVDDALVAEGEVGDERAFDVPASPGLHHVEARLVNPRTRNGVQRRVRLS